ncbi:MAG: hypothetical protein A2Y41_06315 [Spirochaetes bacterium GWB1_36_13]|nr:MAG: hypothetical protein A2Y41_06315 [Spirochaetes bacterium GWB1_36_13]
MKLLLFEDDLFVSELIREICRKNEFEITIVHSAVEAVSDFKKEKPDLVLMDIMLQGKNGIQAMKEIKKHMPKAVVIAITAMAMLGDKENLLSEGFDDYIPKPFDLKQFVEKLNLWYLKKQS